MSSQQSLSLLAIAILVTSMAHGIMGCFPREDVFKMSCLWTQSIGIDSRYHLDVCQHKNSRMTFTPEGEGTEKMKQWQWDCLDVFPDGSYLVKKSNSMETLGYQCIKFSPLTKRVVRQDTSSLVRTKREVTCASATYRVDERVLVTASPDLDPVACPLVGAYQVLMHLPDDIPRDRKCLQQAAAYRPHLQFQCDQTGSSTALADLGPHCMPGAVQQSRAMQGRHQARLQCLDSWREVKGHAASTTSVQAPTTETTVLLRMLDSPLTLWCLHLVRVRNPAHNSVVSPGESLHQAVLTFDGRCSPSVKGEHSVPTRSEMFGKLASFIPGDDMKCTEASYIKTCQAETADKCQESTDCPESCGRCLEDPPALACTDSIPDTIQGTWKHFSREDETLTIHGDTVATAREGDFKCRKSDEGDMFALVQAGQHRTCVPYHTCAVLHSPAPGVLVYRMFPADREADSGRVMTCRETKFAADKRRMFQPAGEALTLLQAENLAETPCNIMATMDFSLHTWGSPCRLTVHECSGPCSTFNVSLDQDTCGNDTAQQEAGLLTQHTCLAAINVEDIGVTLTRSRDSRDDTHQFLCWVRMSTSVFVLRPELCNEDQVGAAMDRPESVPHPLSMLQRRQSPAQQGDTGGKNSATHSLSVSVVVVSLALYAWCTTKL